MDAGTCQTFPGIGVLTEAELEAASLTEYSADMSALLPGLADDVPQGDMPALKHEQHATAEIKHVPGSRGDIDGGESEIKQELGLYGNPREVLTMRITEGDPQFAVVDNHEVQLPSRATELQKVAVLCQAKDAPDDFPTRHYVENGGSKVHMQQRYQVCGARPDDTDLFLME